MMNKELELEARNYGWRVKRNEFSDPVKVNELAKSASDDFIAGATSKYVEKQKLEFAIEKLNTLYNNLQEKYRVLTSLHKECVGKMREQHLRNKKAGVSLAKEEIRRDIKELEQKLSEL